LTTRYASCQAEVYSGFQASPATSAIADQHLADDGIVLGRRAVLDMTFAELLQVRNDVV
jgi:hypothetical protein